MRDTTVQVIKRGSISSTNDSGSDYEDYSSDELPGSVNDEAVSDLTEKLSAAELISRKPTRVTSDRREQNRANSTPWYACVNHQVQSGGSVIQNVPAVREANTLVVSRPNSSRKQIPNLSPTSFANNNFLPWTENTFCELQSEVNVENHLPSTTNLNIPTRIENIEPNLTPPEEDFFSQYNFQHNLNLGDDYVTEDNFLNEKNTFSSEDESTELNLNNNLNTSEDVLKNIIITSNSEPLPQLTLTDVTENLPNSGFESTSDDLLNLIDNIEFPPTPLSLNCSDPDNFAPNSVEYFESSSSYGGSSDYSPCSKFDTPSRRASSEASFCPNNFDDNIPTTVREVNTPLGQNSKRESAKKILKQLVNQKPDFKQSKWILINATAKIPTLKLRIRQIIETKDLNNIHCVIILYLAIEAFLKNATEKEMRQLFEETPILEILTLKRHKVLAMYVLEIMWNYNMKINTMDKSGKNILHRLVEEKTDYNDMISALLAFWNDENRRIFNVNEQDADGLTPLHYAIRSHTDKLETLKILLRNGANFLRTVPSTNQNYLHYAVENSQNMNLVKILLEEIERESKPSLVEELKNAKDNREFTPMDILIRKQMPTSEKNKILPLVMSTVQ